MGYITFPDDLTEEGLLDFYGRYEEALQKKLIRGDVWDLSSIDHLRTTLKHRDVIASCVKRITPALNAALVASGRVVPNNLVRGLVSTVDWLTGSYAYPVKNFATAAQAEAFAIDALHGARVPVPTSARRSTIASPPRPP
jgi:hypothetical protein